MASWLEAYPERAATERVKAGVRGLCCSQYPVPGDGPTVEVFCMECGRSFDVEIQAQKKEEEG